MSLTIDAGNLVLSAAMGLTRRSAGLRTRTLPVNGVAVTFDEGGVTHEPTIVMLHGYTGTRDVWLRVAAGLRGFHVVIPDLLGHGKTPFIPGGDFSDPRPGRPCARAA